MNKSEQINELAQALCKAQATIEDATKDKSGYNYKYADLSQILQIVRPALTANGLSVSQFPVDGGENVGLDTILMHTSGQWLSNNYSMPVEQAKGMTRAQASGSVITYMRRYALAAIVGITQEDNDAAAQRQAQEQEKAVDTAKKAHDDALRVNLASVNAVKLGIADGDLSTAAEAWFELDEDTQRALWLAPSKGGIFTTEERKIMKEDLRRALNGEV